MCLSCKSHGSYVIMARKRKPVDESPAITGMRIHEIADELEVHHYAIQQTLKRGIRKLWLRDKWQSWMGDM